jgi:predicted amidohydrolase YtcJ
MRSQGLIKLSTISYGSTYGSEDKTMAQQLGPVTFDEFLSNAASIFAQIEQEGKGVLVEHDGALFSVEMKRPRTKKRGRGITSQDSILHIIGIGASQGPTDISTNKHQYLAAAIYSMAQDRVVYQAIAIRDEWIVAVSQDPHGLDGLIGSDTHVLDAPDLTILPAFEDTHNHLILAAQNMGLVPVDRAHTLAEFIDLIRQRAVQIPAGTWIQTSAAWHEVNLAEGRLPTAPELDEATRDHPVLVRRGGHMAIANSLALTLGGITRETPEPQGGTIMRFPDGTPTDVLIEAPAYASIIALVPAMTPEQMVEGLRGACRAYNASGIGTVRDPWVMREQVPVYQAIWEQDELTIRSRLMLAPMAGTLAESMAIIEGFGVRSGFGDDLLKLWGLKFGLDGGAEGGALDDPYVNNPGYRGHLLWNPDDLLTLTNFAVRRGWKIGTHAIGDRAVRTLLDVYEQVIQENPGLSPGTLVLEHGFLADAKQRARAIRLGIPVTIQHPLLYTLGSVLLEGWGKERTREIMLVRAWLDEGPRSPPALTTRSAPSIRCLRCGAW